MKALLVTFVALALCCAASHASFAADLLAGQAWSLVRPAEGDAALTTVTTEGMPEGTQTALRIVVAHPSDPFYMTMISQFIAPSLPEGTRLRLHFWARSPTSSRMRVTVEKATAPYTGMIEVEASLTPQWKEYTLNGMSPGYGPNGIGVHFQVGYAPGTEELAGITLENFGVNPELIAAQAAVEPAAVAARIQRCRMGDLTILVHNPAGHPVRNAVVTVAQTRHAFLFGANIFGLRPTDTDASQKAYQERFTALLNYATLPFYWGAFENQQGRPDYVRLDSMAQWCVAHNITPKGHPLLWQEMYPAWAPRNPDAAIPLLHQRVTDLITHYKGTIHFWDVVNEANNAAEFDNGEGNWAKRDGAAAVVGTALGWARTAGQGTPETFTYNDYNTTDQNVVLLTQLQSAGQLPDVIGIQSHMHQGVWKLAEVWQTVSRFAQFGKPIHFTETTVLSGLQRQNLNYSGPSATDWLSSPDGEAAQADYVVRFYSILFSLPSVRAITWWDLSDKDAWLGAPAGLLRRDMSPKPAYTRLMTLIHTVWWTNASGQTHADGSYKLRAFYGDYLITASDSHGHSVTRTLTFPEGSDPRQLVLTF